MIKPFGLRALALAFFVLAGIACREKAHRRPLPPSEKPLKLKFARFDQALWALQKVSDTAAFTHINRDFPDFFPLFCIKIINIGGLQTPFFRNRLQEFVEDRYVQEVAASVDSIFPSSVLDRSMDELCEAFTHWHALFPKRVVPRVVTMVSGFNLGIACTSGDLALGLDCFLGQESRFYRLLRFPKYQVGLMTPEHLVSQALLGWIGTEFEPTQEGFLETCIAQGKAQWLLEHLLPNVDDTLRLGMTAAQLEWCRDHEAEVWKNLADKKILFMKDLSAYRRYTADGPFTPGFPRESPGRLSHFVGYQIVSAFMAQNPGIQPKALMEWPDAASLLAKSKYRPRT
jgi:hypothetical protein